MLTDDVTPNFKLDLIAATRPNWSDDLNDNLEIIDAVIGTYFAVNNLKGIWTNATVYAVNDTVVDSTAGVVYRCLVAHTSAGGSVAFSQDRINNPTYWMTYSSPARARGTWLPNTAYGLYDFVNNGSQFAMCIAAHTSSSSFTNDINAGKWTVLVDLSAVGSQLLPVLGGGADSNKFAAVNPTGTAYIIISATQALANLGATSLGVAVLTAASQGAALSALGAQPAGSYQPLNTILSTLAGSGVAPQVFGMSLLALLNKAAAAAAISPLQVRGDMWFRNSGNVDGRMPVGSNGQVIRSNGVDPGWATPASVITEWSGLANYNASSADEVILATGLIGSHTIILPDILTVAVNGKRYEIIDETGLASPTNSISIAPTGFDGINGINASLVIINTPYGRASVVLDTTSGSWWVDSKQPDLYQIAQKGFNSVAQSGSYTGTYIETGAAPTTGGGIHVTPFDTTFTPKNALSMLEIDIQLKGVSTASDRYTVALFNGATLIDYECLFLNGGANTIGTLRLRTWFSPGAITPLSLVVYIGCTTGASFFLNQFNSGVNPQLGMISWLTIKEFLPHSV